MTLSFSLRVTNWQIVHAAFPFFLVRHLYTRASRPQHLSSAIFAACARTVQIKSSCAHVPFDHVTATDWRDRRLVGAHQLAHGRRVRGLAMTRSAKYLVRGLRAGCKKKKKMHAGHREKEVDGVSLRWRSDIWRTDRGSFTPLVFSSTGSAGPMADTFLQRLVGKLSEKDGVSYSSTIAWLRCRFSFALLRGSILCIRGSRSRKRCPTHHSERELAIVESRLDLH